MFQNIFILGATGNVGKELVSQVMHKGDIEPLVHESPTRIIGLVSSKDIIFSSEGFNQDECEAFSQKKEEVNGQNYKNLDQIIGRVVEKRFAVYGFREKI